MPVAAWEWEIATGRLHWQKASEALRGLATIPRTCVEFVNLFHPDDRAVVEAELERVAAEGGDLEVEARAADADGSYTLLAARGGIISEHGAPSRVLGVAIDLGRPTAGEGELDRQAQFRAVFENSLDAMLIVDSDLRYVDANPAACELLAVSRAELLRRRAGDFWTTPAEFEKARAAFFEAGYLIGDCTLVRGDGTTCEAEFTARANFFAGRHLITLRDVTRRRHTARLLRSITAREREVLTLLSQGLSTGEIAGRLYVTPGTVRTHIASLVRKLEVPNRHAAGRLLER